MLYINLQKHSLPVNHLTHSCLADVTLEGGVWERGRVVERMGAGLINWLLGVGCKSESLFLLQ